MNAILAPWSEVDLSAGESVATGAAFAVSWVPTVNHRDDVTVIPAGADAGEFGNYIVVRDKGTATLTAPISASLWRARSRRFSL